MASKTVKSLRLTKEDMDEAFNICVKFTQDSEGCWNAKCVKGNFSVFGRSLKDVKQNAYHYFLQYHFDGEYENLLRQHSVRR